MSKDFPPNLFGLIHGMTSPERRYFTISSTKENGEMSQYYKLYEAILKQLIVSDDELRDNSEITEMMKGKNLSVEKKRLQTRLVAALRQFDTNRTPAFERRNLLSEIQSLDARGKTDMALAYVAQLKRKAQSVDDWLILIELNMLESKLEKNRLRKSAKDRLAELGQELEELMENLKTKQVLRSLWDELLIQQWSSEKSDLSATVEKVNHVIAKMSASAPVSWTNRLYLANLEGLKHTLESNLLEAELAFKRMIGLYEENAEWVNENLENVLLQYYNYLNVAHANGNYMPFERLIPIIEGIEDQIHRTVEKPSYYSGFLKILFLANTGKIRNALEFAKEQNESFESTTIGIPPSSMLANQYNLFILQFLNEAFSEAYKTLDSILAEKKVKLRMDLKESLRIFEAILQFELGNIEISENKLRSLKDKKLYDPNLKNVIPLIYEFMKGLINDKIGGHDFEMITTKLIEIRSEIPELETQGLNEILLWIESKSSHRSILSLLEFPLTEMPNRIGLKIG